MDCNHFTRCARWRWWSFDFRFDFEINFDFAIKTQLLQLSCPETTFERLSRVLTETSVRWAIDGTASKAGETLPKGETWIRASGFGRCQSVSETVLKRVLATVSRRGGAQLFQREETTWEQSRAKKNLLQASWTEREETGGEIERRDNFRRFDETAENTGEMNVRRGNRGSREGKLFRLLSSTGRAKLPPETIEAPEIVVISNLERFLRSITWDEEVSLFEISS